MAKGFGATEGFSADDAADGIMKSTGGMGVDYAFEAIGIAKVVETAMRVTRRGGMTVMVGVGPLTESVSVNALAHPLQGKTLCGCMYGSANVRVDFPKMLDLYRNGSLDLEGMVTKTYSIDQAPQAFEDLESGINARGVIAFD